jgi:hypothetical protein
MFPCSHGNISFIYGMRKKGRKSKEHYFTEGEEEVREQQPQAPHPQVPPSFRRTHSYRNLPYNSTPSSAPLLQENTLV